MEALKSIQTKAGSASELLQFFLKNKWWWLVPMLALLLVFGLLILLAQSSAIAPFIYTLF
jgi:hypothetical protein